MNKIFIPISEYDLEEFKDIVKGNKKKMTWQFPIEETGEEIEIIFKGDLDYLSIKKIEKN